MLGFTSRYENQLNSATTSEEREKAQADDGDTVPLVIGSQHRTGSEELIARIIDERSERV